LPNSEALVRINVTRDETEQREFMSYMDLSSHATL